MPTESPRIQVLLDPKTNSQLLQLAAFEQRSLSATAADLIRDALELQEDRLLSAFGDKRLAEATGWASHAEAWGDA